MITTKRIKLIACCISVVIACSCAAVAADSENYNEGVFTEMVNPEIPMKASLAGETVNLDRIDMAERLDRELTSIVYGHSNTSLVLKRANRYFPMIAPILEQNGVPVDFIYLAAIESSLNVRAYSRANAAGLWQFLAATAKQYGLEVNDEVDERYHPEKSTLAACKYLKAGYKKYGHWATVAASYNAGMGRISGALEKQLVDNSFDLYLNEETSRYVFRFLAMKMVLENPRAYGYCLTAKQLYQPIACKEEAVSGSVASWSQWARDRGISYAQLRELNPWIRASSLTNKAKKTYTVKIPITTELYRSKRKHTVWNKKWVK
ncbi:MAG: lytic transglycosylase domain-containing protein [Bacteroidales bacterium]|nr:lytic transglycosylase domain-containing protein [Bacteroidales bacterium]